MDKKLEEILNQDLEKNIATIGFFENFPVEEYYIEGNSAIFFGESDNRWAHIASSTENELSNLLNKYASKAKYYFSVEDWMIPLILKHGQEDWSMPTNRYILDKDVPIDNVKMNIRTIDISYASFVHKNSDYKKYTSVEYIQQRLKAGTSAGIFTDNELVAWGFTHDDGALGFLHVLDKHRKKGYANEVVLSLIQQRRQLNKTVFCNIVPENSIAINFVTKLGFHFDRKVSWLKLK